MLILDYVNRLLRNWAQEKHLNNYSLPLSTWLRLKGILYIYPIWFHFTPHDSFLSRERLGHSVNQTVHNQTYTIIVCLLFTHVRVVIIIMVRHMDTSSRILMDLPLQPLSTLLVIQGLGEGEVVHLLPLGWIQFFGNGFRWSILVLVTVVNTSLQLFLGILKTDSFWGWTL